MSELVGFIQFSVGQLLVFKNNRRSFRRALYLFFKQLMNTFVRRIIPLGVVPLDQKLMLFSFGVSNGNSLIRCSGLSTIPSSKVRKCPSIRVIVASSNKSVLYCSDARSP